MLVKQSLSFSYAEDYIDAMTYNKNILVCSTHAEGLKKGCTISHLEATRSEYVFLVPDMSQVYL